MYEQELEQLMGMGAAKARARAALERTRGDLMGAAERVFAGEYDDLPSDDEEVVPRQREQEPKPTGLATPAETPERTDQDVEMSVSDEDSEGGFEEDDDVGYNDGDDGIELDTTTPGTGNGADPYSGIFFSKDRTETISEIREYPIEYNVNVPPGAKLQTNGKKMTVVGLTRGEWMSGCPEGNEQSFLFQLYDILSSEPYTCPHGCGNKIERDPKDFFSVFPDFDTYICHIKNVIRKPCSSCAGIACAACGERVVVTSTKGKSPTPNEELYHCANLQGVILGVALNMVERLFDEQAPRSVSDDEPASKKTKGNQAQAIKHFGGTSAPKGTGYSGGGREDTTGQEAALEAQKVNDRKLVEVLRAVRPYLPCLNRPHGQMTSDYLVHPTSLAHLRRRSNFLNKLLRNDSLLDMSNREQLYSELFGWLEVVSGHEALASMLAMPQMRISGPPPPRLEPIPAAASSNFAPVTYTVTYEGAPSPRELLENIVIQAQAALKGLEHTQAPEEEMIDEKTTEEKLRMTAAELAQLDKSRKKTGMDVENAQLRDFCQRIVAAAESIDRSLEETKGVAFVKRLRASLPQVPQTGSASMPKVLAGATDEETIKAYVDWATKVRFQYCDMLVEGKTDQWNHAYTIDLAKMSSADAPKRSLAIAKELATLTTNLPVDWHSTIFMRVDETRVDCIKALIVGPEGTPYENGCFLFDILLPINYNQSSPSVKSMTTNGGRYRFNPNLYACGKVCLSLLGTWQGPGWIAGQSTLLQVLISIQSLIMNEEPYLNEPGWAGDAGSAASKRYSANVRRMTLHEAMINSIKDPPFPFADEIHTHFRLKANAIRKQMERWVKKDDGLSTSGDGYSAGSGSSIAFQKRVDELTELLEKLEKEESVITSISKPGKSKKAKK